MSPGLRGIITYGTFTEVDREVDRGQGGQGWTGGGQGGGGQGVDRGGQGVDRGQVPVSGGGQGVDRGGQGVDRGQVPVSGQFLAPQIL